MTYRNKTQELIRKIWELYDEVGRMRDYADASDKQFWNSARNSLYNAAQPLIKHDDIIDDKTANAKL